MFSPCLWGFPPANSVSDYIPKTYRRVIQYLACTALLNILALNKKYSLQGPNSSSIRFLDFMYPLDWAAVGFIFLSTSQMHAHFVFTAHVTLLVRINRLFVIKCKRSCKPQQQAICKWCCPPMSLGEPGFRTTEGS